MDNNLIIEDSDFSGIPNVDESLVIEDSDFSFTEEKPDLTPERLGGAAYYNVKKGIAQIAGSIANVADWAERRIAERDFSPLAKTGEKIAYEMAGQGGYLDETKEIVDQNKKLLDTDKYIKQGKTEDEAEYLAQNDASRARRKGFIDMFRKVQNLPSLQLPVEFQGPSSGILEDVAANFGGMAPNLIATAANPGIGISTMWLRVQGALSEQMRQANPNASEDEIFKQSALAATIETPLEAISELFIIKSLIPKGVWTQQLMRVLMASVGEGATELIQEFPEIAAMTIISNPDMPMDEVLNQTFINGDSWKQAGYSGFIGMILGGGIPGTTLGTHFAIESMIHPRQKAITDQKVQRIGEILSKPREELTTSDIKEVLTLTNQSKNKIDNIKESNIDRIVKEVKKNVLFQHELSESEGRKQIQESLREVYKEDEANKYTSLWDAVMESAVNKGVFENIDEAYDNIIFQKSSLEEFMQRMNESKVDPNFQPLYQEGQIYDSGQLNTQTPEFDAWFQNSVASDENGTPSVFYHGTDVGGAIEFFDKEKLTTQDAFFFSEDPEVASNYSNIFDLDIKEGATVYPVYLSLQNPLRVDWKGQKINQGKVSQLIEYAKNQGNDGIVLYNIKDGGPTETQWAVFDPEQIKSVFNQGSWNPDDIRILYQEGKKKPLGALEIDKTGKMVIHAFEGADLSTPIHETGHMIMEMMSRIRDDGYFTLGDWAGVDPERLGAGYSQWTEAEKEKIARAFKVYMMEGKAPSQRLRDVFAAMRKWLVEIYKSVLRLNVKINDDVRNVFDNWLASQEEIENNIFNEVPEWLNVEPQNTEITIDSDYEDINQKAKEIVSEKFRKRREKEEKQLSRQFKKEAEELVENEIPIYRIMNDIVDSGGINRADIERLHGKAMTENLHSRRGGLVGKNGIPLDQIAIWYGYQDEQQLLDDILNSPSKEQFIETYVNEMWRGYEAGLDYMNAEIYEEVIDEEIKTFGKLLKESTKKHKIFEEIKQRTEKVKDITKRPDLKKFEVPESELEIDDVKALREQIKDIEKNAKQAYREGKKDATIEWKLKKKDAISKLRANAKILTEKHKINKDLNLFIKNRNLPIEYRQRIIGLLEGFYNIPLGISREIVTPKKDFYEFFSGLIEKGDPAEAALDILEYGLPEPEYIDTKQGPRRKPLKIEDIRNLHSLAKMIVHFGKTENEILQAKEKGNFEELIDNLTGGMYQFYGEKKPGAKFEVYEKDYRRLKSIHKIAESASKFLTELDQLEFIFRAMDGFEDMGPIWESCFDPISKAEDSENLMANKYFQKMHKIFAKVNKKKGWASEEYNVRVNGKIEQMRKQQIIMAALNTGNDGNLTALKAGWGFSDEEIDGLWDILDKNEKKLVYDVWETLDSLFPGLSKVHEKLTGLPLQKIEGYYFPLVFESKVSDTAARHKEISERQDLFKSQFYIANPWAGHRIARKRDVKISPRLEMSVITKHLFNVIHDITHQIPVRDVRKIFSNTRFRTAVKETMGENVQQQLMPWLQHVARPVPEADIEIGKFIHKLRRNATTVGLGLNATTSLVQPLSFTQTIDEIGFVNAMRGLKVFYGRIIQTLISRSHGNIKETIDFVKSMSPMMNFRGMKWDRDLMTHYDEFNDFGIFKGNQIVRDAFFSWIQVMDKSATYPTWIGAYLKGLKDNIIDGTPDYQKAVDYADMVVRRTQPTSSPKDLSYIQRGGKNKSETVKMFTMFYTFFSKYQNRMHEMYRRAKVGNISPVEGFVSFLWITVVPAILADIIRKREKWRPKDIPVSVLSFMLAGIPVIRDFSVGVLSDYDYTLSPIETAGKSLRWTYQSLTAKEKSGEKILKNILRSTGYFWPGQSGLPTTAMIRFIDGALDISRGDTDYPTPLQPFRLVLPEETKKKKKYKGRSF